MFWSRSIALMRGYDGGDRWFPENVTDKEVDEVGLRGQYRNGEWRRESEGATVISEFLGLDSFACESSESERKRKSVSVPIPKENTWSCGLFQSYKASPRIPGFWISVTGCLCSTTDPPLIQLPVVIIIRKKQKKASLGLPSSAHVAQKPSQDSDGPSSVSPRYVGVLMTIEIERGIAMSMA